MWNNFQNYSTLEEQSLAAYSFVNRRQARDSDSRFTFKRVSAGESREMSSCLTHTSCSKPASIEDKNPKQLSVLRHSFLLSALPQGDLHSWFQNVYYVLNHPCHPWIGRTNTCLNYKQPQYPSFKRWFIIIHEKKISQKHLQLNLYQTWYRSYSHCV